MSDLFGFAEDGKRQRLRDLGCREIPGFNDFTEWVLPDGRRVSEAEAFRWLASQEGDHG